ncbi:MAG: biliverdin-producing heme oxygenase [Pseudomonadota bacterium]
MGYAKPTDNLRHTLRGATASAHDLLDGTMRAAAGWASRDDYARFLSLQYAARLPVETWLADNAPADLNPPAQASLIAQDLVELGEPVPASASPFDLPVPAVEAAEVTRAEALGAAWVLAGSSLGNRAILAEVRRAAEQNAQPLWPTRFLSDAAMLDFWKGLRTQLEGSADIEDVERATCAAAAVFEHFIAHAQTSQDGSGGVPEAAQTHRTP